MTLSSSLKRTGVKRKPKREGPVWKGPEVDGITQSLLSRYMVCKERFRLLVVEGLRPVPTFNHKQEYGQMWHICEEGFASEVASREGGAVDCAFANLGAYCRKLCKQYPLQQEQIQHWYNVCKIQFPIYVDYWAKSPDEKKRTPLLQEEVFDVPYKLPSGRIVRLRGKWDGVDLIGKGKSVGIYLQENKTKGNINEQQMQHQLMFDLQTMIYLIALIAALEVGGGHFEKDGRKMPTSAVVRGVRYNVVRRPLSGGKHSIKPLAGKTYKTKPSIPPETPQQYYARLGGLITEEPKWYFMRWKVEVTAGDIERFKREFLNPKLEELCDWWVWISGPGREDPFRQLEPDGMGTHSRTPYGFWNILAEGGSAELDEYLATGSELGLERTDKLFKELEG